MTFTRPPSAWAPTPQPLVCLECGACSIGRAEGWKAYLAAVDGDDAEVGVFCPDCSQAEFEQG